MINRKHLNLTKGTLIVIIGIVIASVGFVLEVYTEGLSMFPLRETYVTVFFVVALVGATVMYFGQRLRLQNQK